MSELEPTEYGWMLDEEGYRPVGTMEPVVPEDLLQICGCKTGHCATKACKCRGQNTPCTTLCGCEGDHCENTDPADKDDSDSSDEEGESDEE